MLSWVDTRSERRRRVRSLRSVLKEETLMFVFNWYTKLTLISRDESIE